MKVRRNNLSEMVKVIKSETEQLRRKMHETYAKLKSLTETEVLEVAEEVDRLIIKEMKERNGSDIDSLSEPERG